MGINGLDKMLKDLDRMEREFPKECRKATNTIGKVLKDDVKHVTPKVTGELQSSIIFRSLNNFEVLIGTTKKYAPHVNYGHKTKKGTGKISSRINSKAFVKGKYFLERGINNFKNYNMMPVLEHCIKRVLK